jgi:hypothetical protein
VLHDKILIFIFLNLIGGISAPAAKSASLVVHRDFAAGFPSFQKTILQLLPPSGVFVDQR